MPELPEVETIRKQLSHYLPLEIINVEYSPFIKSILHTKIELNKKKLIFIKRKGKMLNFVFSDESSLLSHLGMSGSWLVDSEKKVRKHTHLTLTLRNINNQKNLYFNYVDPRRFGHMYYLDKSEAQKKLDELGTDLLDLMKDYKLIQSAINRYPNRTLKVTLLDQKLFAGSGNYIANEICARSGILPTRICSKISTSEIKRIQNGIKAVLDTSLSSGGTTFQGGYQDSFGNKGEGVNNLIVFYQKICQNCKKSKVKKIILNQRGTYFCPKCQK